MEETFYLISSASSDVYENTRASFTNNLPKTFSSNFQRIRIAVEKVVFDNSFSTYESDSHTPDIILGYNKQVHKSFLGLCTSLQDLCEKLSACFSIFQKKSKQEREVCTAKVKNNKIFLDLHFGSVKFSRKLFIFLELEEYTRKVKINGASYYVLREEFEKDSFKSISSLPVRINERSVDFVDLVCESIEGYPSENQTNCEVLCSIPVNEFQVTTYHECSSLHFHNIESSYLRSLKIGFRQRNGEKVYFDQGPPNLVKFNLKMYPAKKDFFYITVSSKPTDNFPENTPARFQVELPKEYTLSGDWVTCITNAYIPPPRDFLKLKNEIYEIEERDAYCCVFPSSPNLKKKCAKLDLLVFTRRELCIFFQVNFPDFFEIHLNEEEDIYLTVKKINDDIPSVKIFTSYKLMSILNNHDFIEVEHPSKKNVDWYDGFSEVTAFIKTERLNYTNLVGGLLNKTFAELPQTSLYFEMKVFYNIQDMTQVLLTQIDILRRTNSQSWEFIKKEELRLSEWYQRNKNEGGRELLPSLFFIYCDFVKEIPMGDRYVNVLKTIPYKNGEKSLPGGFYSFQTNEYYNISKQCLRTLDFLVKTQSGEPYQFFTSDDIRLTLKFEKIK